MGHSPVISAPDQGVGSADPALEDAQRVEATPWKPSAARANLQVEILSFAFGRSVTLTHTDSWKSPTTGSISQGHQPKGVVWQQCQITSFEPEEWI